MSHCVSAGNGTQVLAEQPVIVSSEPLSSSAAEILIFIGPQGKGFYVFSKRTYLTVFRKTGGRESDCNLPYTQTGRILD